MNAGAYEQRSLQVLWKALLSIAMDKGCLDHSPSSPLVILHAHVLPFWGRRHTRRTEQHAGFGVTPKMEYLHQWSRCFGMCGHNVSRRSSVTAQPMGCWLIAFIVQSKLGTAACRRVKVVCDLGA
jgi:hypothetical protein